MKRTRADKSTLSGKEGPPGITRTTMSYDGLTMLCHFVMAQGAKIPLHNHPAAQHGYVIRGRVHFLEKDGPGFIASTGTSYLFEGAEYHGAEVLEDTELVEFFSPARPEYADN